jgi:hypothetical protein
LPERSFEKWSTGRPTESTFTAAVHRSNLPQIRACLDHEETARLARAFGVPVLIDANVRDDSLRQTVYERQIPMLLFEAGEALRFDEQAIRAGVRGPASEPWSNLASNSEPMPIRSAPTRYRFSPRRRASSWVARNFLS